MTASLTFYTNPMSRGQIARWMLEEVGAPYDQVLLDFGSGMKDAAYLAINPMGKVPAIKHGEHVVTECAAICAYLADAFPDAGLAPPLSERADYYRWLFFAAVQEVLNHCFDAWQTRHFALHYDRHLQHISLSGVWGHFAAICKDIRNIKLGLPGPV